MMLKTMSGFVDKKNGMNGFSRIGLAVILPFIILVIAYTVYKLFFIPDPVVTGTDNFKFLSADKTVRIDTENLKEIEIFIYQDGKIVSVLSDEPEVSGKTYSVQVKPKELGLSDGPAITVVKARSGILKDMKIELDSIVDTVPPTIAVIASPSTINQGGSGFAVLKSKGADIVSVKLVDSSKSSEDKVFPAFRHTPAEMKTGASQELQGADTKAGSGINGAETYYVFFPAPFDIREDDVYYAVASDAAGNQSIRALKTRIKSVKYKKSSIGISDSFINEVISPLLNRTDIDDPVGAFKEVNEGWRDDNNRELIKISTKSENKILWAGRFLQLKNSKVMATYGDQRTYTYEGKEISGSVHLGYDLASFAYAPVGAANSGVVSFAGNLGIYGNTVIIDHGMGLMSLYGHLSSIAVGEGQSVEKGEMIGKSGATGLAGGDHLHLGILIHGFEVSPLYWWDPHWIQVHITDYFE